MKMLSATDVAIALAHREGTLRVVECTDGRFGPYWTLEDAFGVIEVALSADEAEQRVAAVVAAAA